MADRPLITDDGRLRLLDAVGRLTKEGARAEASLLTTFSVTFPFYEDVILRLFERAGCRLNVLMVDAGQLAAAMADPLQRPRRAGRDYILAPIVASGVFHPKLLALFAEKRSMLAVGSHNATEAGFARNLEATVCWGHDGVPVPAKAMGNAVEFAAGWLGSSPGIEPDAAREVSDRLRELCPAGAEPGEPDATFVGWRRGGPSLIDQLSGMVRGQVRRVIVIGPFFDRGLELIREVYRRWNPQEIVAAVQHTTVSLGDVRNVPQVVKFVDAAALMEVGAKTADTKRYPPYLHAKALAVETADGLWLALGSANPSAPAWLQTEVGNVEAAVILSGSAAAAAFGRLELGRLWDARSVSAEDLDGAAARSAREIAASQIAIPGANPVRMAFVENGRVPLPGIDPGACRRAVDLGEEERPLPGAAFSSGPDGTSMTLGDEGQGARLVRVDGDAGPLVTVVIHSLAEMRAANRPRSGNPVLERLGTLENLDENLDDLLGILHKYLFAETDKKGSTSSSPSPLPLRPLPGPGDAPFGPRGVSIATLPSKAQKKRSILDFELSEIISLLIRDLTEPRIADGDDPDRDLEDVASAPDAEKGPKEPEPGHEKVGWPRLVTACRKRVGLMNSMLCNRLAQPAADLGKAIWLFGRMLTVLSLVRKLRDMLPPEGMIVRQPGRPKSLISTDNIRVLFKGCMGALYRPKGGIADWIESSADKRLAEERLTLDALLLWAAREIGADAWARPGFHESKDERIRRLGDTADILVAAMSAAANREAISSIILRAGSGPRWPDAPPSQPDWLNRHMRLGEAMQAAIVSNGWLPELKDPVKVGDVAMWMEEAGLPRIVVSAAGNNITLIGLGDRAEADQTRVKRAALAPVDMSALL